MQESDHCLKSSPASPKDTIFRQGWFNIKDLTNRSKHIIILPPQACTADAIHKGETSFSSVLILMGQSHWNRINVESSDRLTFPLLQSPVPSKVKVFPCQTASLISGFLKAKQLFTPNPFSLLWALQFILWSDWFSDWCRLKIWHFWNRQSSLPRQQEASSEIVVLKYFKKMFKKLVTASVRVN